MASLYRRLVGPILVLMILSTLFSTPRLYTETVSFEVKDVSFTNSAGYPEVYPGSRAATLTVYTVYTGSQNIYSVSACLYSLPQGFEPRNRCSGSNNMNHTYSATVSPGEMVYFTYVLDISRTVSPGYYPVGLNITYRDATGSIGYYLVSIVVKVSQYPPPRLDVRDSYLAPTAYPGTLSTDLYIVVVNNGDSDISSGEAIVYLPPGMYVSSNRVDMPSVPRGSSATIVVRGVSVRPQVSPGVYTVSVFLNTTATTTDGVSYSVQTTIYASIEVSGPPGVVLDIVSYGWSSPRAPRDSLGLEYRVSMRNRDIARIENMVAVLRLPECMSFSNGSRTQATSLSGPIDPGSVFEIRFSGILVSGQCSGDTYYADLVLSIYASIQGSEFYTENTYRLVMRLTNPSLDIRVSEVSWSRSPVYPGSMNTDVVVVIDNRDPMDVRSLTLHLYSDSLYPRDTVYTGIDIPSGSRASVSLSVSIPPATPPGPVSVYINMSYVAVYRETSYLVESSWRTLLSIDAPPRPLVEVVYHGWVDTGAYNGSVGNRLRVLVRDSDIVPISSLVAELRTGTCCRIHNSDRYSVAGPSMRPGDVVELVFDEIEIPGDTGPGLYYIDLVLSGMAGPRGSEYWFNISYRLSVYIERPELRLALVDYGWSSPAVYENTSRASLYVVLRSFSRDTISSLVAVLHLLNTNSSRGSREVVSLYEGSIGYGDTVRIEFSDIEVAGQYIDALLGVYATLSSGETRYTASQLYRIRLYVVDETVLAVSYINTLYRGSPAPVLVSARDVVLRIGLVNTRPEPVSSVSPRIELPAGVEKRYIDGTCLGGVSGGGSCYIDVYLDVSERARPGLYTVNLSLDIYKSVSGSVSVARQNISVPLYIEDPADYTGRPEIVSLYWGTTAPTPVFNYTRYAPLTIRLVNTGRYPLYGLTVSVYSEDTEAVKASDTCAQTLAPGGSCTATLYLDIKTEKSYVGLVINTTYLSMEYGSFIKISRVFYETMRIESHMARENMTRAVEYITSFWLEGSVGPNTMGAHLVIVYRNNYVDSMRGVYLVLRLPEGLRSSIDNSTVVRVLPAGLSQQVSLQGLTTPQYIEALLRTIQPLATQTPQVYNKGDFIVFTTQINIYSVGTGVYRAEGTLYYTDSLGVLRYQETYIEIPVMGSTKYIDVEVRAPVLINQSRTRGAVYLTNIGSAPVYEVYLAVYPTATPLVVVSPSVYYIERLDPGARREVPIEIVYSPYTYYQTEVRYGTVPLMVSIVYRDVSGSLKTFNTTYAVVVEPFIELSLRDLVTEFREGVGLYVSGVVVNFGSATAQRAVIEVCVEGLCRSTVIGDMDPGSQNAFRVEVPLERLRERTAVLRISYYDVYNTLQTVSRTLYIEKIVPVTTTPAQAPGWTEYIDVYKIGVGAAVVAIVAVTLYMLYRTVSRRLGERTPPVS